MTTTDLIPVTKIEFYRKTVIQALTLPAPKDTDKETTLFF